MGNDQFTIESFFTMPGTNLESMTVFKELPAGGESANENDEKAHELFNYFMASVMKEKIYYPGF